MRMLFITAALALTATPVLAKTADKTSFKHEGVTYVFTSTVKGDAKVLQGKAYPGGTPFYLVVRGGRVDGTSGFAPVSFKLSEVERIESPLIAAAD